MASISVVIMTLNAERLLKKCLESVKEADEIIVCDMYSEDNTVEIAKNFGCKVVYHEKCGYAEPARNFANNQVTSDWLLVLDADELVTPQLWKYLKDFAQNPPEGVTTLEIPRETYALGQKLRCMYQSKMKRFWKRGCAEYKAHVHNIPHTLEGKDATINPKKHELAIQHYHIDSIQSYLEKTNRYTDFEMERFAAKGTKFNLFRLLTRPLYEFFKFYILKGGIFDGVCGLIICFMNAQYKFIQLAKLYEVEFKKDNPDLIY